MNGHFRYLLYHIKPYFWGIPLRLPLHRPSLWYRYLQFRLSWLTTCLTRVYGGYNYAYWGYEPTYNWGDPHIIPSPLKFNIVMEHGSRVSMMSLFKMVMLHSPQLFFWLPEGFLTEKSSAFYVDWIRKTQIHIINKNGWNSQLSWIIWMILS